MVGKNWDDNMEYEIVTYFVGEPLAKAKNRVFVKLDIRYTYYFPEYTRYFERALLILNSMYGMTNYEKAFAYELTEWLLEAGFFQSQC